MKDNSSNEAQNIFTLFDVMIKRQEKKKRPKPAVKLSLSENQLRDRKAKKVKKARKVSANSRKINRK